MRCRVNSLVAGVGATLLLFITSGPAHSEENWLPTWDGETLSPVAAGAWDGWTDQGWQLLFEPPGEEFWAIDFRCRGFIGSSTSFEFGTPPDYSEQWAPLSRLDFSLNSCWYGLYLGIERPTWAFHLEWMMAGNNIDGIMSDFDWSPPNPDGSFTDLGFTREEFTEGQMLDVGVQYQLADRPFGMPFELWPLIGFRWQRFNITNFDLAQVKYDNEWLDPPDIYFGDVITFNQQYYTGYAGAQLRGKLEPRFFWPVLWTLQGDWGYTEAYNVDHHLLREGDMYAMHRTHGDCWHTAITLEALVTQRIGLGFQADYLDISTTGSHRWLNEPYGIDETWDNGVKVWSTQTWLTGFLRIRY